MNLYLPTIKNAAFLLLLFLVFYYPCQKIKASSPSGDVTKLKIDQISSFKEMKAALNLLKSSFLEAKQKNQFTFRFQKLILSKSGECISRMAAIEQQSDLTLKTKRDKIKALFLTNRGVIKEILTWNQKKIEDLQENKLDQMEDTTAFFNSPEWQQPQYLISLSSYWLSWNGYYSSPFYPANDAFRKDLLGEAVDGFSRSLIDFKEESIIARSLFGRALCYKEMQKYDKAIYDINSVIGRIKRDNPLYVKSRYEKVMISYLTGSYESALSQLKNLREEMEGKNISSIMDAELKKLRVKIILVLLEKDKDKRGEANKTHYRNALQELKKLVASDESQAGELYRFVKEHVNIFRDLSYTELGPVGNLAIADRDFDQKQYDKAVVRYKYLLTSSDPLIKKRMDEVYFRSGYCLCQKKQWQDALTFFESLFNKFPHPSFTGKIACLYYVAATNHYKESPEEGAYTRYIEAIKIYLKRCNDPKDKSEAHFQLGKYYQDKEKTDAALKEFSLVGEDSPNYLEARYNIITANTDKLESLNKRGLRQSKSAGEIYRDTKKQLVEYQKLVLNQEDGKYTKELEAHITLLQAKLCIYSPEGTYKKALNKLKGFEKKFPLNKTLHLTAKSLRMECYKHLQMFKEAKAEINSFLKEDVTNSDRWTFLHECANNSNEEAKRLRDKGKNSLAKQQSEMALVAYKKLSSIALKNKPYKRFYDAIQLRMAEIYNNENQTAKAKAIYKEMLKKEPRSADAMYNLGLIYEKEGNWEEALATWRKFSRGLKTGSYYWFESRYRTAKLLKQLNRRDEACEITTMVHVLHPELRDERFKEKFMELQEEACGKEVK